MTETDREHLGTYRQKQQTVIDRVNGIAHRRHNGLYVWGDTGVGKTWNIEETLQNAQDRGVRSFRKLTGKCTPLGLFELARDFSDAILFIDDDPTLVQDRLSQQILLHLCGDGRVNPETGRNERLITNIKSKTRESCVFTGSVIISNNVRLANMPVLRALQGRIRTYHFRPTSNELVAMLRHLTTTIDHPYTDETEKQEICEFIIAEAEHSQQQIDLRLLKHGLSDYEQYMRGEATVHWKQLIVSSMQDYFSPAPPPTREERKSQEQDHILELIEGACESGGSRESVIDDWLASHGKKKTALYDRLKELPEESRNRLRALPDKRSANHTPFDEEDVYVAFDKIEFQEMGGGRSRSLAVREWAKDRNRTEEDFPLLLRTLEPEWQRRYEALGA